MDIFGECYMHDECVSVWTDRDAPTYGAGVKSTDAMPITRENTVDSSPKG